jgi:hypothetical protein
MTCLTDVEVSKWLEERNLVARPYGIKEDITYCMQFRAPNNEENLDLFLSEFYSLFQESSEMCLDVTDWDCYEDKMIGFASVRRLGGETRILIEASGHVFRPHDQVVTELFKLSSIFGWSSYVYTDYARTTLHCWEGELYDFWTDCSKVFSMMTKLIAKQGLERTS